MKPWIFFAAAALLSSAAPAQTLPPRDECGPEFAAFRAQLLDIIARRDAARLLEHLDPQIEFSFGGDGPGRDAFAVQWGLATPETSALWTTLAEALLLGCARSENGEVAAPYLFVRFPQQVDVFSGGVARPGARLYSAAGAEEDGVPIAWQVVTETENRGTGWTRVRLADGRSGFIPDEMLLSPIGWRAIFAQRGGRWLMTAFIAGD